MGLYNVDQINKGEFVIEYKGELVCHREADFREKWKPSDNFYDFDLDIESIIDSRHIGNKSRFINHSKQQANLEVKVIYVDGDYRIGLYAKTDIQPATELFFDYDGQLTLHKIHPWILGNQNK